MQGDTALGSTKAAGPGPVPGDLQPLQTAGLGRMTGLPGLLETSAGLSPFQEAVLPRLDLGAWQARPSPAFGPLADRHCGAESPGCAGAAALLQAPQSGDPGGA